MVYVKLTGNFKKADKTYIVGLDGSETSLRAVQVAAQAMNDLRDNLIIVTLCRNGHPKDKETYDRYVGRAKDVAMKNHIPVFRIYTDFVQVEDDVTGALCSLSNAHANGSSILVIGAAGKGDEDKNGRRPEGQPPMGSIAAGVLAKIKVPVLLVKAGAKLDLEVPRVKRQGRDSTPGLNIMVSIDGSAVSERAFDLACKVSTKLDTLYVYHVQTDEDTSGLMNEMRHACEKLLDAKKVAHAGVIAVPKTRNSIREMIEEFVEVKAVDILFMGSVVLSKSTNGGLGSVSSSIAKASPAHCCIVKNFATT